MGVEKKRKNRRAITKVLGQVGLQDAALHGEFLCIIPSAGGDLGVSAGGEKEAGGGDLVVADGLVEWGPAPLPEGVYVATKDNGKLNHLAVAAAGGQVKEGAAPLVGLAHIRPAIEKRCKNVEVLPDHETKLAAKKIVLGHSGRGGGGGGGE